MRVLVAAAAALMVVPGAAGPQEGPGAALTVRPLRFFAASGGGTMVEGLVELRLGSLAATRAGPARYRVEIAVTDSAGLELMRDGWARDVPDVARARGASAVESFRFAVSPGRYRVLVRVVPESGSTLERNAEITAYGAAPGMSDLLVATAVRQPGEDSAAARPGEVLRGGLLMQTAPAPRLTPTAANLSWYAELYRRGDTAAQGQLHAAVLRGDDSVLLRTAERDVEVGAGGGVTRGQLDLAGLPEGAYRLRVEVRFADGTVGAEAPFVMSSIAALATGPAAPARAEDEWFDGASEPRLDSLYEPLMHLIESREQGVYQNLSPDGKRRFLKEFWRRRDPTPASPDNPPLAEFYREVAYVNEAFYESGAGSVAGWRTDRGRIYLRNGRPDEVLRRPSASPRPYEVWKVTRERPRYYVFYDQSGFGHFVLIGTNDRRETGLPQWETYLGPEGSQDVMQFLGLDRGERDRQRIP